MDDIVFYFYTKGKERLTQRKVGYIIKCMINDKEFFKNNGINKISNHFNISKKSLIKYFKDYKINRKNNKDKRIYFKKKVDLQFFKDLDKIILKYGGLVDEKTIQKSMFYMYNLEG